MLNTPLQQVHVDAGARMVDFAGWSMPLLYSSIAEEHVWTRTHIGLFDVSHMGRLELTGTTAAETLENLCTRSMVDLAVGATRYCLMCNECGGVLDDLMVSRLEEEKFYVVCNASNREKIISNLLANIESGSTLVDRTFETGMIAVQGPQVVEVVARLFPGPLATLPHRHVFCDQIMGVPIIAFRGGYTGEDGLEVVLPGTFAPLAWGQLAALTLDDQPVVKPVGLGARDTLRLEAGLPLYGHELTDEIDPLSARLDFAVDFDHEYLGRRSLEAIRRTGPYRVRVGLKLRTRRAARPGFDILYANESVGSVTSGACTPTVNASIAMALLRADLAATGTVVQVKIGNEPQNADVVPLPFYKRAKKGHNQDKTVTAL